MPLLTFYALLGRRGTRVPIASVDRWPTDWLHLKRLLVEVMKRVHTEHKQAEAEIVLEQHLSGKFFVQTSRGRYSQRKVRYKREYEAFVKVRFNPKNDAIHVVHASFGPALMHVASDYWRMERNIRYRSPPLIPREHQSILENPKLILMEQSAMRYADYSQTPKTCYQRRDEKHAPPLLYGPLLRLEYGRGASKTTR